MGLIVDTSEFIHIERQAGNPTDIIQRYGVHHLYGVSAMTIAELQHGVQRADSDRRRAFREQFLETILRSFPVYPLDISLAIRLGDLDAHMQKMRYRQAIPDLIIAATAIEYRFEIATRNIDHFKHIPGSTIAVPLHNS